MSTYDHPSNTSQAYLNMYSWVSLLEGYLANMKSELHFGGLVQACSISSALTMDILQYYNKTFICAVRAPTFNKYRGVWPIPEYVYKYRKTAHQTPLIGSLAPLQGDLWTVSAQPWSDSFYRKNGLLNNKIETRKIRCKYSDIYD